MSETNVTPTPEAVRAKAAVAIAAREDGIRGAATLKGRKEREEEILRQLGVKALEDAGMVGTLLRQHAKALADSDERWKREEMKHGRHRFWQGVAIGGMSAGAMIGGYFLWSFNQMADTIARTTRQDVMTGAIVQASSTDREPSVPSAEQAPAQPSP